MSPQLSDFKALVFDVYGTLCVRWIFTRALVLISLYRVIGLGDGDVRCLTTLDVSTRR